MPSFRSRFQGSSFLLGFLILYFLQGLPYGLQSRFLPIWFRTHGMSLSSISFYRLLLVPWVFKAVWAPLVDNVGSKLQWAGGALVLLVLVALAACTLHPSQELMLACVLLLLNLVTSVQDVAVDGLMIDLATSQQLALGNTAQVVGYKAGTMLTGGLYMWLIDSITWTQMFGSLAAMYMVGGALSLSLLPPAPAISPATSTSGWVSYKFGGSFSRENLPLSAASKVARIVIRYVREVAKVKGTGWMLKFLLLYKLGEAGFGNIFPLFLVDMGVPAASVGVWTGLAPLLTSMAGSSLGAMFYDSMQFCLKVYLTCLCVINALTMLCVTYWGYAPMLYELSILLISLASFFSGAVTTCTFTLCMQLSQRAPANLRASHYTVLATVEVLGKLLFTSGVGLLVEASSYSMAFLVFLSLSVLTLPLIHTAPPEIVEVHAEQSSSQMES